MTRLQFLGGGKMAEALLGGLVASGWAPTEEITVVEKLDRRRDELADRYPDLDVRSEPVDDADVLIAVKPQDIDAAVAGLRGRNIGRVLSIAAGIGTGALEAALEPGTRVVRAMPNTPALVATGAAAVAGGSAAAPADIEWATEILRSVGSVVTVDEAHLDAVTGLSGSGPAYVFLFAEALVAAGVDQGLAADVAAELTEQTLLGAARLLRESDRGPERLRADVTSPGGTTAEGIRVLEEAGLRAIIARAVAAATDRSRQLGGKS